MTPEEIEAFREWCRTFGAPEDSHVTKALKHIDQQAKLIKELETGLDEAVKVVQRNAGTICTLRVKIADLDAQIAALKDITISERERRHIADMSRFGFVLDSDVTPDPHKIAKDQLTEEYPEIFR